MTNPFEAPQAPLLPDVDERARSAGQLGVAALVCLSLGACCGVTTLAAPFLGAAALTRARSVPQPVAPESPTGLYLKIARLGGWLGVGVGLAWLAVVMLYVLIVAIAVIADM